MNIEELPYLHFLLPRCKDNETFLLSPLEADNESIGGEFYAPLQPEGGLFKAYRFHYSVYLGEGRFFETEDGRKALFTGLAISSEKRRPRRFLLTFESMTPNSLPNRVSRSLYSQQRVFTPFLETVPGCEPLAYGGNRRHRDFESKLVELRLSDSRVLDEILDTFAYSVIGCDPHSEYER